MSTFLDFEDKNVEKAIEKACKELKVTRDHLKYDIISHGSSGIFGLVGTKKAHIRVTVPGPDRHHKGSTEKASDADDKTPVIETTPLDDDNGVAALVAEAFGDEPPAFQTPPDEIFQEAADSQEIDDDDDDEPGDEWEDEEDNEDDTENEEDDINDEDDSEEEVFDDIALETDAAAPEPDAPPEPTIPDEEKLNNVREWAKGFLNQVILEISPESEITMDTNDKTIIFKIQGGETARLIGKKGQTLDAVQYLADKAVNKLFGSSVDVEIDVEDYLDKRRAELVELAKRLALKANQTGKPMVINRINSHDRRIVHLALKENRDVRTQSAGNGDLRKLLILPKKKPASKKQPKAPDEG